MSSDLFDLIAGAAAGGAGLDRYLLRQLYPLDKVDPFRDPTMAGPQHRLDLGRTSSVLFGRVVDTISYCHWYKVQFDTGLPVLPCCCTGTATHNPVGVRDANPLPVNTAVVVLLAPELTYGVILGTLPHFLSHANRSLSDYISQQSRCGIQVDGCHQFPSGLEFQGDIINWSDQRPCDQTSSGEKGWFSETGLGIHIDSFMAFLRACDDCGVWAFFHDRLLRLAGHALQERTCASNREVWDHYGEANVAHSTAPFFWEALGAYAYGETIHRELTPEEAQLTKPHYAVLEPVDDRLWPYHRHRRFEGYLGQGGKRQLSIPPHLGGINLLPRPEVLAGVFEEQLHLSGAYAARTAKSYSIVKRILIPVPREDKVPENLHGDTPDNYRSSGLLGQGEPHNVTGDLAAGAEEAELQRVRGTMDRHAYGFNWEAVHVFAKKKKSWKVPEENEILQMGERNQATIPFAALLGQTYLQAPPPIPAKVDHRYGAVNYYPNMSYFELLDDGGIVLGDGYGAELVMTGGHIFLTAPGDVWLQPGRNLNVLAGHDLTARAHNCVDLSSTAGPCRFRSFGRLWVKGDGMLLDSTDDIMIRAPADDVDIWSRRAYLRSGVDGSGGIYLDAGQGADLITCNALTFERFLGDGAFDYFGLDGVVVAANVYSADGAIMQGNLGVVGCGAFTGQMFVQGWYFSTQGYFASPLAPDFQGLVADLTGPNLTEAEKVISDVLLSEADAVDIGIVSFADEYTDCIYLTTEPGSATFIEINHFWFRSTVDYATADLILYESRWQQLARLAGGGAQVWLEVPEPGPTGLPTYPYPGEARLPSGDAFRTLGFTLWQPGTGNSTPRSDAGYLNPRYANPEKENIDGNYYIIDPSN